ncbi:MAG: ATP-binding cassette domain-containing protein [Oscillospiraceae bacterium]|jgi:ABC-type nitrate/sulfonate/bicarbonate transport system ATPase subunit
MIGMESVSLAFGERVVLKDCSVILPEQGVLCLFGPSGCGKTTLARVLTGLQRPDEGKILGICPGEAAVVFQEHRLLSWLTVRENITAVLSRHEDLGTIDRWLRATELEAVADRLPSTLSGGMQRRVALARALAYGGRLLVLDEPFQGLDIPARRKLYPYIRAAAETKPVMLITHDRDEAMALADAVWFVDGPPLEVIERQTIQRA